MLTDWEKNEGIATAICIEIRGFTVKEDNRRHVNPFRKMSSNDQTTIVRVVTPSNPNMQETCRMDAFIFTGDFTVLAAETPFMVNISGVVIDVQSETISQNGNAMKKIRLQDSSNKAVNCVAFDRHSVNPALQEGNLVVLYFAAASSGLRNSPGALWMYNESHIVLVRAGCRVLPSAGLVSLQGRPSST